MDLRQMGGSESHIINNDDITIILNGCPHNASFLREGEIYQLPEPHLLLVMNGEADIQMDLEHYHIEKGTLILTTPDMIMECTHCSMDLLVNGIAVKAHIHIPDSLVMICPAKDTEHLLRMMYLLWDISTQQPYRHDTVKQMTEAMLSNARYINRPLKLPKRLMFRRAINSCFSSLKCWSASIANGSATSPSMPKNCESALTIFHRSSARPAATASCTGSIVPLYFGPGCC